MKGRIHRVADGEVLGSEAHEGRVHRVGAAVTHPMLLLSSHDGKHLLYLLNKQHCY